MPHTSITDRRTALVAGFFEGLTPERLQTDLPAIYTDDAHFKDPFNEVQGLLAIRAVFEHMFATTQSPRFVVIDTATQGDQAWLSWHFLVDRAQGETWCIRGATQIRYAPDGRICHHRDYWDPVEELYVRLPVLGIFMRWITRRLSANASR